MELTPAVRPEELADPALLDYVDDAFGLDWAPKVTGTARQTIDKTWRITRDGRIPPTKRRLMLAALGGPPAQPMHPLSAKSPLTAPERAMQDATFRKTWKILGRLWLSAKAAKFKPDHPATKRWKRISGMLDEFEHVGETPEPDGAEPWPAVGHPLHH